MRSELRNLRLKQLDRSLEQYQAARKVPRPSKGWIRAIRQALGVSSGELARRLGAHESQVSRDERNEYFGITLERAAKILDVLNVRLHTKIAIEPLPPAPVAQAS